MSLQFITNPISVSGQVGGTFVLEEDVALDGGATVLRGHGGEQCGRHHRGR